MLQLLLLLLILFGTYSVLAALHFALPAHLLSASIRGRQSLAALFVFTGMSHFVMPEDLAELLPPSFPLRMELITVIGA